MMAPVAGMTVRWVVITTAPANGPSEVRGAVSGPRLGLAIYLHQGGQQPKGQDGRGDNTGLGGAHHGQDGRWRKHHQVLHG